MAIVWDQTVEKQGLKKAGRPDRNPSKKWQWLVTDIQARDDQYTNSRNRRKQISNLMVGVVANSQIPDIGYRERQIGFADGFDRI